MGSRNTEAIAEEVGERIQTTPIGSLTKPDTKASERSSPSPNEETIHSSLTPLTTRGLESFCRTCTVLSPVESPVPSLDALKPEAT